MNLLSAARIAGEIGLAGGAITGGCCAAKYSKQVKSCEKNGHKGHHDLKNVMEGSGLVSRYLLDKKDLKEGNLKTQVEWFKGCLHSYVADTGDSHCIYKIPDHNALKEEMRKENVSFS